jgi:hypothetical protein
MNASDTASRHCASRHSCHHRCLIRDPHSGHLPTLQNPRPAGRPQPAPRDLDAGRANHQNPVTTFLLPAAILGVVTSMRTGTADRDVPRESREKQ